MPRRLGPLGKFISMRPGRTAPIPAATNARMTRNTNNVKFVGLGIAIATITRIIAKITPKQNAKNFSTEMLPSIMAHSRRFAAMFEATPQTLLVAKLSRWGMLRFVFAWR